MFEFDFYPTPEEVIEQMIFPEDVKGKRFLEPSAGSGNIVDYLNKYGAKSVEACEKQDDLRVIVASKCSVIAADFLALGSDDVSHINCIVMNPPFSDWKQHILHAWEIAPEGCEIISLCNYESLENERYNSELNYTIRDYGTTQNLGACFSKAERKTNVEIGLIKLYKPITSSSFDYNGFFLDAEPDIQMGEAGQIMPFNEIRQFVEHYVRLVKTFDEFDEVAKRMGALTKALDISISENIAKIEIEVGGKNVYKTKADFVRAIQKKCWRSVFRKMNIEKFVTAGVMNDINKFVEDQYNVPFTTRNIYRMVQIIVSGRGNIMNRAIEEAIDNITKYTAENRYGVEGWKTNSGYMLNKKFILNYGVRVGFRDRLEVQYGSRATSQMDDLVKAICFVTGKNYDDYQDLYKFFYSVERYAGVWYDFGIFEIKGFKKGTIHAKFKNLKDWELVNRAYAEIKGEVLPESI